MKRHTFKKYKKYKRTIKHKNNRSNKNKKIKTSFKSNKTVRHIRNYKRGGVESSRDNNMNINNFNENQVEMSQRRIQLRIDMDNLIDLIDRNIEIGTPLNVQTYINQIDRFHEEAEDIDEYFGNNLMQQEVIIATQEIIEMIQSQQVNIDNSNSNNNETITLSSYNIIGNSMNSRNINKLNE